MRGGICSVWLSKRGRRKTGRTPTPPGLSRSPPVHHHQGDPCPMPVCPKERADMAEKTTLEDVKRIAWAACDTFRGVIDASEYKDFILVFLFLKYVSDVWKEHYQEADQRYQGDRLRIARTMARERFVIPNGPSFDDLLRQLTAYNIGELIDEAFDAIADANKAKIGDAFADVMFNSETKLGDTRNRNRRLKTLIEDFAKLDLRPSFVASNGNDHKTAEDVI